MAISEDLRGIQAMLDSMLTSDGGARLRGRAMGARRRKSSAEQGGNAFSDADAVLRHLELARLLCDNLSAIADQVEALEALPLAVPPLAAERLPEAFCPSLAVSAVGVPLQ